VNKFLAALLLVAVALAGALPAHAQFGLGGAPDGLLEPEKAFRLSARALGPEAIEVTFAIAEGYYLYRDKFRFSLQSAAGVRLGEPAMPPGIWHKDDFFGEVETYRKQVSIRIPLEREATGAKSVQLLVTSQGCADVGVCYVPMDSKASIRLTALGGAASLPQGPGSTEPGARFSIFASDFDIARLFEGPLLLVLASFLVFGVLLTFTPCVLPMIPILSGIIAGEGRSLNKVRALALSLAYVLGMALTYAVAGVAAALSGSLLAPALQSPWVLGAFALVFVWLALSMFGFYELRLPGFVHHRLDSAHQRLKGGRLASVAAMGMLSAIIVSPCVVAPLAGALLYISQTGDVALGGAALFSLALGMGVPLVAVGVSGGALLPSAGAWMNGVRRFFGVLLLAVAVWIISPAIPVAAQMLAWAALLIGSGVFLRAIDPLPLDAAGWQRVGKALGVMAVVAGAALLVGALSGSRDPLRPLAALTAGGSPSPSPV
jgi:thioredoxin:protein disulfide reductase